MPLDATAPAPVAEPDPFVEAGLIRAPSGGGYVVAPATPATPTGTIPVIDVGTPASPAPKPGEMGSELRPVVVGPEAKPGTAPPAQPVPPQPGTGTAAPAAPPAPAPEERNPFTDAGLPTPEKPKLPDKAPEAHPLDKPSGATASNEPWCQPLWEGVKQEQEAATAFGESVPHSFALGFDQDIAPIPAAILRSHVRNIPFSEAYNQIRGEMQAARHSEDHPIASAAGELF